jgi:hypothetical protein
MERPTGVTILALLGFLSAALLAGTALVMFVSATFLANLAARPGFDMLAGSGGAVFGVAFLVFAAFYLVGAIGLWKLQNWARILVIVLCGLGALLNALGLLTALLHFQVLSILEGAVVVALLVWILLYLLKPRVKQAFGATGF